MPFPFRSFHPMKRLRSIVDGIFGDRIYSRPDTEGVPIEGVGFKKAEEVFLAIKQRSIYGFSTYRGSYAPSRRADEWQREVAEPEARKREIAQLESILADDPMLLSGVQILTHGAVGDSFNFIWKVEKEKETKRQEEGRKKLERAQRLSAPSYSTWCEEWFIYGDGFYQLVASENDELIEFDSKHPATMERLTDHRDRFFDPLKAYRQRDVLTRETYRFGLFSDFQMVHARRNKRTGDRYGRSGIFASRQSSIDAVRGYAELIKRRFRSLPIGIYKTSSSDGNAMGARALQRFKYGEEGEPDTALPEIRAQQGDTDAIEGQYAYRVVNLGDFRMEAPNVSLGEVGDLEALTDRALASVRVPRALITGDVVNFATLNALLKHLYSVQRILARTFELTVIRPLFDRVLLLADILPEEVEYEIDWGQRLTIDELQFNAQIALKANAQGLWNERDTVAVLCQLFGRKDAEKIIEQNRVERQQGLLKNPAESKNISASLQDDFDLSAGHRFVTQESFEKELQSAVSNLQANIVKPNGGKFNRLEAEVIVLRQQLDSINEQLRKVA